MEQTIGTLRLARKSGVMAVAFSLIIILLFCYSSFSTPIGVSSVVSSVSGTAKISKTYSVNQLGSLNWAGYAIAAPANSVSVVRGSWIEPAVSCPTDSFQVASFWIGMDGLTSSSVEQTGTMAECNNGAASYSAWYEFYPNSSVNIKSMVIHPGDVISAVVKYSSLTNKFTTTIKDVTTAKSSSHGVAVPGALRNSAEWIAEAPSSSICSTNIDYICPLADFGTVSFGKGSTLVNATDTATISGVSQSIGKFGANVDSLEMVSYANSAKAEQSSLVSGGTSFSVTWAGAGP